MEQDRTVLNSIGQSMNKGVFAEVLKPRKVGRMQEQRCCCLSQRALPSCLNVTNRTKRLFLPVFSSCDIHNT